MKECTNTNNEQMRPRLYVGSFRNVFLNKEPRS